MAAFGSFDSQDLPFMMMSAGIRTDFGTITPPGSRIVGYVRSSGQADYDSQDIVQRLYTSLNTALAQCRSGRNDIVLILPGHTENIAAADAMSSLVAGTQIIGLGAGNSRPTFTWTAAASTFLLDVANVRIQNCILNMDPGTGTTTVAAPMTVSAAGCQIQGCSIRMGTDANSKVTIGITTTAAADDFVFVGNQVYGATAAECTTMMQFVGADRLQFHGNTVVGATSSASVGVIRFLTTASTDIKMFRNIVRNNKSGGGAGDMAITGMAGVSGEADHLLMVVLGNNVASLTAAWGTPASMIFGRQCYVANTIAERAALFGTESA